MLYRPLLLLSILHSSFNVKHLTMNSFAPMYSNDGVYSLSLFFSSFYFECMLLFSLFIGQTVILGVREENIAHILSILISTCRCGDVGNHLRSSPLFYSFFPFKGGGNAFFSRVSSCLCSVSSFFLSRPFALFSWDVY
jgi:hypothetical protein